jgi:hypothetical protein
MHLLYYHTIHFHKFHIFYITKYSNVLQDHKNKKCECFSRSIAPNVPAVYDVLVARIRALRSKDQGRQNVAEVLRGNEAKRNDLAKP